MRDPRRKEKKLRVGEEGVYERRRKERKIERGKTGARVKLEAIEKV